MSKKVLSVVIALEMALSVVPFAYASQEYINVCDYGAKGDGITDDLVAIREAIEEAKKTGLPVYVPAGEYIHSDMIDLDGVTMFGDGYDLSVFKATTYRREAVRLTGKNPQLYNMFLIGMEGLRNAWESSCCGYVENATDAIFVNNRTYRGTSAATSSVRSDGTKFLHNYLSYSRADGNINFLSSVNLEVANNLVWNTGDDGIAFTTYTKYGLESMVKNVDCHDNAVFSNPGSRGITVNGAEDVSIYNNYCDSGVCSICVGADKSWESTQNKNITVKNNILKNCNAAGTMSGGAITIRNDRGNDGKSDTSKDLYFVDNDIYMPAEAAVVTYGEYPIFAQFENNHVFANDDVPMFKHKSKEDRTSLKKIDNMKFPEKEYGGDKFELNVGPDYSIDWGLPKTDANIAKKAKVTVNNKKLDKLNDEVIGNDSSYQADSKVEAVFEWDDEIEVTNAVIESYDRSAKDYSIEYYDGNAWNEIASDVCSSRDEVSDFGENIKTKKMRFTVNGENKVTVDEIKLFKSLKLLDKTEENNIDLSLKRNDVGNGSAIEVFANSNKPINGTIELIQYKQYDYEGVKKTVNGFTPDFTLDGDNKVVDGKGSARFLIPEEISPGQYNIEVCVKDGDKLLAKKSMSINVVNKFGLFVSPDKDESGNWILKFIVSNLTENKIPNSQLKITDGGKYISNNTVFNLDNIDGFETKVFEVIPKNVNVKVDDKDRPEMDEISAQILINGFVTSEIKKITTFAEALYAENPIIIDGVIGEGEWDNAQELIFDDVTQMYMIPNWNKDNFNGKCKIKWDNDNLYVLTDILDKNHVQKNEGENIWNGDSIQIAFDSGHYSDGTYVEAGTNGYTEIGVALSNGKTTGAQYNKPDGMKSGAWEKGKYEVKRDGEHTIYECAMPWSELLPDGKSPKNGNTYGFALVANEANVDFRDGFMAFFEGIGMYKRPEEYGEILLIGGSNNSMSVSDGNVTVNLNGTETKFKSGIVKKDGAWYIPARNFLKKINGNIMWENGKLTINYNDKIVMFMLNSESYLCGNVEASFVSKPLIIDDTLYLSVPNICNMLDFTAYFENDTIYLNAKNN